ncbi:hypothetical protein ABLM29_20685, partial [Nocardioides sp. YIM 152588]
MTSRPDAPAPGPPERVPAQLVDALAELVLGSACVACERPGRPLCRGCLRALPDAARAAWPTPAPPGLAPPYATGAYEGALRAMVLAHKERGVHALAHPLGRLLATAARAALVGAGTKVSATALREQSLSRSALRPLSEVEALLSADSVAA